MTDETQSSYDSVAADYAHKYLSEFDHKPMDRQLLDRFASMVKDKGRACDLGCGPGQVARYLKALGVDVMGVDLSEQMVDQARQNNPGIPFQQGDMRHLDLVDGALAGIAAFYCIIHIPREDVTAVLRELRRVLKAGGVLLITFHAGEETRHMDEFFGKPVSLDFRFFKRDEMETKLKDAGFVIEDVIERGPYPEVEAQTNRVYIFARNP
jgi:SAM-dependent methyltransferase